MNVVGLLVATWGLWDSLTLVRKFRRPPRWLTILVMLVAVLTVLYSQAARFGVGFGTLLHAGERSR